MSKNVYNQHTFNATKKVAEDQIKQLQEVLKIYETWLNKNCSEQFDYTMPMTFLYDIDEIANNLKIIVKKQTAFITEVLKATKISK